MADDASSVSTTAADAERALSVYECARRGGAVSRAVIDALVAAGGDINAGDSNGVCALQAAVYYGHDSNLGPLIEAGADPTLTDVDGHTPLMSAAYSDRPSAIRALLSAGVDPNYDSQEFNPDDVHGEEVTGCPLTIAAGEGNVACVEALLESSRIEVDKVNHFGLTPLFRAANNGHVECVHRLIAAGAAVDYMSDNGLTPFLGASMNVYEAYDRHMECARALARAGANCDATFSDGPSGLKTAMSFPGTFGLIPCYLRMGASVPSETGIPRTLDTKSFRFLCEYFQSIRAAGGFAAYELGRVSGLYREHRLAFPLLPTDDVADYILSFVDAEEFIDPAAPLSKEYCRTCPSRRAQSRADFDGASAT